MSPIWVSGEALGQWRQWACQLLRSGVCDSQTLPERLRELDWLLVRVTNLDRLAFRLETFQSMPSLELTHSLDELSQIWEKRLKEHIPLQYLLGSVVWRDFSLSVAPGVLIPRPETELLIDLAQQAVCQTGVCPSTPFTCWADLGTGSGAIALGLARSFPDATIHAVDVSEIALAIAQENATRLGLTYSIQFWCGSWFEPLTHLAGHLDGILSNPPYIPSGVVPTLQAEVALHEPSLALDGGEDGLSAIRLIVDQAPHYLRPGGILFLEMMLGQADAVMDLLESQGEYQDVQIHPDLDGVQRFAQAKRR